MGTPHLADSEPPEPFLPEAAWEPSAAESTVRGTCHDFRKFRSSFCFCSLKKFILCSPQKRRRQWPPTPVFLPGKSRGRRSLVGCSPWGRQESDTTEWLHFHFSLSCIGEGNGNPLQCCCLENPRDGGAWWAAVYGVAQSRTRLKRLSSSSSSPQKAEILYFLCLGRQNPSFLSFHQ